MDNAINCVFSMYHATIPICHSLTDTYRNLNKGNGRTSRYKRGLVAQGIEQITSND